MEHVFVSWYAIHYAVCMPQLVTRVDEGLLADIDRLVESGTVNSRSEAVRVALRQLIDRRRRREIGEAIAAEYAARPQTAEEVGWSDAATLAMIEQEPW
jgi:Arc/MetJ-type ribon-helix-helix transcriptional regulator